MNTTKKLLLVLPLLVVAACSKSYGSKDSQATSMSSSDSADVTPVDTLITERVRFALQQERTLAPELATVGVTTREGVVKLTGTVSSEAIRDRFTIVTKAVGSVARVDNQLTIKKG
jgi:osmotically-inducible protein OsmY